jgi:hypothetical protein
MIYPVTQASLARDIQKTSSTGISKLGPKIPDNKNYDHIIAQGNNEGLLVATIARPGECSETPWLLGRLGLVDMRYGDPKREHETRNRIRMTSGRHSIGAYLLEMTLSVADKDIEKLTLPIFASKATMPLEEADQLQIAKPIGITQSCD